MTHFKLRLLLLGAGTAIGAYALSVPAAGQDSPESILPPGFDDPTPPAPATPSPPAPTGPATPAPPAPPSVATPPPPPSSSASRSDDDGGEEEDIDDFGMSDLEFEDIPMEYELPPGARRSLDLVGPLTPELGGYGEDSFSGWNGPYVETLMRRVDAPLPSRWLNITLRRGLLSQVPTPANVSPPDWIAERAWLLLRMGEVDAARMLVQRVDSDRFTPKLYAVAMQVGLAAADPAAFCPLVSGARRVAETPAWVMADAICAGFGGESTRATAQISAARRAGLTNGFDLLLGEKLASAGGTSRAVTIEWEGVERLNIWRYGMATATGEEIPEELFGTVNKRVQAWRARAPSIPIADRLAPARTATAIGVLSNEALVTMYSAVLPEMDPDDVSGSTTGNLRAAYVRGTQAERLSAMREIWSEWQGRDDRYAALVLTARAAARVEPSEDLADDSANLIASMLSAGFDIRAARWADSVESGSQGWALLAVGAPTEAVEVSYGRVDDYADTQGAEGRHRAQLLAAALAGLGRLDEGEIGDANEALDLGLDRQNIWTQTLDRAAQRQNAGMVAVIAAIGMQSPSWSGIPPAHLYHVVRALRLSGRMAEARMIAAEAITRA
ncbi:MAG: hypothetical protein RLN87_09650 [Parasphingopyxis sp.]|uniref:hypothetical protein n=1 Tax=Parasphingopyxis sp. TaxID=1920299 RepID=UPI0032EFBB9C